MANTLLSKSSWWPDRRNFRVLQFWGFKNIRVIIHCHRHPFANFIHKWFCGGGKYLGLICRNKFMSKKQIDNCHLHPTALQPWLLDKSKHAFGLLESGPVRIAPRHPITVSPHRAVSSVKEGNGSPPKSSWRKWTPIQGSSPGRWNLPKPEQKIRWMLIDRTLKTTSSGQEDVEEKRTTFVSWLMGKFPLKPLPARIKKKQKAKGLRATVTVHHPRLAW